MGDLKDDAAKIDPQKPGKVARIARGALQVAGGAVPRRPRAWLIVLPLQTICESSA